jgi:hypothetical protein
MLPVVVPDVVPEVELVVVPDVVPDVDELASVSVPT